VQVETFGRLDVVTVTRLETRSVEEMKDDKATTGRDRMCGVGPAESECSGDGAGRH